MFVLMYEKQLLSIYLHKYFFVHTNTITDFSKNRHLNIERTQIKILFLKWEVSYVVLVMINFAVSLNVTCRCYADEEEMHAPQLHE